MKTAPIINVKRIAVTTVFVLSALLFSLFPSNPTGALSVDLGKTITNVTNNIPIVNNLLPVETPKTPINVRPQPSNTPVAPGNVTPQNSDSNTAPVAPSSTSRATSPQVSTISPFIASSSQIPTGLSVIAKQGEILEAPAHTPSPALMYSTNRISPDIANLLFILGVAGIFAGGCIIFATRQTRSKGATAS